MKIALYKRLGDYSYESIKQIDDYIDDVDFLQISEAVEIEFVMLPAEVTVPKEVASIEATKEEIKEKYITAMAILDEKISKLLAIEDHSNND